MDVQQEGGTGKPSGAETLLLGTLPLQIFDNLEASQHRTSHSRGTAPNLARVTPSALPHLPATSE